MWWSARWWVWRCPVAETGGWKSVAVLTVDTVTRPVGLTITPRPDARLSEVLAAARTLGLRVVPSIEEGDR